MTYRTILTARGRELEAEANASGVPIVITDMAVGDGGGNPVTPDEAQTALVNQVYRAALNQLSQDPDDPTRFIAELVIPIGTGGFVIREVGLYTLDNELFAVANVPATYKPTAAEGAFSDTAIRMVFQIANASAVTLVVDPNVTIATRTWVLNSVTIGGLIPGGLTGQVLTKASNADGDTEWSDPGAAVEVVVYSREETQTLAAAQTVVNLLTMSALGAAVYIEGVRLEAADFSQTGPAQITLAASYPDGTKITAVQNEEVGMTDLLLRPNNLSDVPDKAAARVNLGLPSWLASQSINWSQLTSLPAFATRWPAWDEVTSKPSTFPPSAHTHVINDVTGLQTALNGKAAASHTHVIGDVTGLQTALNGKVSTSGNETISGTKTFASASTILNAPAAGIVDLYLKANNVDAGGIFADTSTPRAVVWSSGGYVSLRPNGRASTVGEMKVDASGNVTVGGSVTASAGFQSSTERLKKNIRGVSIEQAAALLSLVDVVEFDRLSDNGHAVGVIAERLAGTALDFVVARDTEGRPIAVDYSSLTMIALRVTQATMANLSDLNRRLAQVEATIGAVR